MKEKTLKKIRKLLAKEGVEEEKIDSIVADIEATEENEETTSNDEETPNEEEGNPTPPEGASEETEVPPVSEEGASEGEPTPDLVPPEIPPEGAPAEGTPGTPTPGSIEDALGQLGVEGQVPPEEQLPPTPEQPPVPPTVDPQIQSLLTDFEELKKANEGLLARVKSLEDALTNAGVIEGSTVVGDERPSLPQSEESQANDQLDSILRTLNKKY